MKERLHRGVCWIFLYIAVAADVNGAVTATTLTTPSTTTDARNSSTTTDARNSSTTTDEQATRTTPTTITNTTTQTLSTTAMPLTSSTTTTTATLTKSTSITTETTISANTTSSTTILQTTTDAHTSSTTTDMQTTSTTTDTQTASTTMPTSTTTTATEVHTALTTSQTSSTPAMPITSTTKTSAAQTTSTTTPTTSTTTLTATPISTAITAATTTDVQTTLTTTKTSTTTAMPITSTIETSAAQTTSVSTATTTTATKTTTDAHTTLTTTKTLSTIPAMPITSSTAATAAPTTLITSTTAATTTDANSTLPIQTISTTTAMPITFTTMITAAQTSSTTMPKTLPIEESSAAQTTERATAAAQTTKATSASYTKEETTAVQTTTRSTASTTSTVPSTKGPVIGAAFKPKLDKLTVKLDLNVSIELKFKRVYEDPSTLEYQNLTTEFYDKLKPLYQNLAGFKKLTILGFRNGSTVAIHQIDWSASVDVTSDQLFTVSDEIKNLTIANSKVKTSIRLSINATIRTINDKCNAEGVCGSQLACIGGTTGSPSCVCRYNYCQNDGICNAISKDNYMCSCKTTDDYVYSGDHCELSTRRKLLGEGAIIGISVGLGGGALILVIVIVGYLRCRKNKRNKYRDRQSDAVDLPELSFPNLDKMRISQFAAGYNGQRGMPNYGFEPEPSDLRYHRRSDHGRNQATFFDGRQLDVPIPCPMYNRRDIPDDTRSDATYDELDVYETPGSRRSRDFTRSSNLRRSSYDQLDEPRAAERRYSQISSGTDPGYQPLKSRNIREGDSGYQRINSDPPYLTMY